MIGDVLLIEHKHQRVSQEIVKRLGKERVHKLVISVSGESGSGKSEVAETLREILKKESYKVKILHLDNYYKTSPAERNTLRRTKGVKKSVGLQEIDWETMEENVRAFKTGKPTTIPFIDLFTSQEDKLITNFKEIDILIIEGLYALNSPADIGILIGLTYHDTKKAQLKRGKEKMDSFRLEVLKQEHAVVSALREKADFIITPDFTLSDHRTKKKDEPKEKTRKLLILSSRLPVRITKKGGKIHKREVINGMIIGIQSVYHAYESQWAGLCGADKEDLTSQEKKTLKTELTKEQGLTPLFLPRSKDGLSPQAFCSNTLWPLFHYFTEFTQYEQADWESYIKFNQQFYNEIKSQITPDITIWIHNYELMLLSALIRNDFPDIQIGFFFHTPFPSFEIFRLLPWRKELLTGMMGCDLIGFHTYDYARHFLSSISRILGYTHSLGRISAPDRLIRVDAIPMGIDYQKFIFAIRNPDVQDEIVKLKNEFGNTKIILSVDRLDYTKGVDQRLEVIRTFLERYPKYRGKVIFRLHLTSASQPNQTYKELKKSVEISISSINKTYGRKGWIPVIYTHKILPFNSLVALYCLADIALVTSIRDGMNLMAKEYLAARQDGTGALIVSEMAGVEKDLAEALIINPNNKTEIVEAIRTALEMPEAEQLKRNRIMQDRLRRFDAFKWIVEFMDGLENIRSDQKKLLARKLSSRTRTEIMTGYHTAESRLLILDYENVLTDQPDRPSTGLLEMIRTLTADPKNRLILMSNLDQRTMDTLFGSLKTDLVAGGGIWVRLQGEKWSSPYNLKAEWKKEIRPIMETFLDRTPGSILVERPHSFEWQYDKVSLELGNVRSQELMEDLLNFSKNRNLTVRQYGHCIEIRTAGVNKAKTFQPFLKNGKYEFILSINRPATDPSYYELFPSKAYTVMVGNSPSPARNNLDTCKNAVEFLKGLLGE